MRMKFEIPKLKQSEIANQLGYSSSTLQRNRKDKKMHSINGYQLNNTKKRKKKVSNTRFDNNSHRDHDLRRPQMT